jgi:hypothetical protein
MKKLWLVPALLVAACGDNLSPDADQVAAGAAQDESDAPADTPDTNPLSASFQTSPASCADHAVNIEGIFEYADGTPVSNPICHYDLGDGTSADTCSVRHSYAFGTLGEYRVFADVTLTVTDPATGATATRTEVVFPPGNFDAFLIPSTDGLSISWEARAFYVDGEVGIDHISIEPADKVILDDPSVLSRGVGTVRVTEPGTYIITLHAAVFPGVEGCFVDFAQTVEVTCDGGEHTH